MVQWLNQYYPFKKNKRMDIFELTFHHYNLSSSSCYHLKAALLVHLSLYNCWNSIHEQMVLDSPLEKIDCCSAKIEWILNFEEWNRTIDWQFPNLRKAKIFILIWWKVLSIKLISFYSFLSFLSIFLSKKRNQKCIACSPRWN